MPPGMLILQLIGMLGSSMSVVVGATLEATTGMPRHPHTTVSMTAMGRGDLAMPAEAPLSSGPQLIAMAALAVALIGIMAAAPDTVVPPGLARMTGRRVAAHEMTEVHPRLLHHPSARRPSCES